jgi:hypothetical protein
MRGPKSRRSTPTKGPGGQPGVTANQSFLDKHYFLVRRLHSLTGIVPIGVFLIAHLVTNSSLLWGYYGLRGDNDGLGLSDGGVKYFQHEVSWINTSIPHLLLIEIALWGSIAFHSILGFYYAFTGKRNTDRYAYQDNWRYTLQRWSGYIGIIFIFYHVATLRWGWNFLVPEGTLWSHSFSASTLAAAMQGSTEGWTIAGVIVSLLYFVGITLLVFHFASGPSSWSPAGPHSPVPSCSTTTRPTPSNEDVHRRTANRPTSYIKKKSIKTPEIQAADPGRRDHRRRRVRPSTSTTTPGKNPGHDRQGKPHSACRPPRQASKTSHSVKRCAQGGINACNEVARQQGYSEYQHFDETIYGGDYLADQTPRPRDGQLGPQDHRPARPHGRPLQPHQRGPPRPPPLRRFALQAHPLRRRDDRASSSSTPSTSRPAATKPRARSTSTSSGSSSGPSSPTGDQATASQLRRHRRPGHAHDADPGLPGRRRRDGHRRQRPRLRPVHQLGHLHRRRRLPLLPGRRLVRQRRDDPGPPDRDPRRRQVPPHERVRPRRGRPRLGAPQAGRHTPAAAQIPEANASTSSKSAIPPTATSCPATSPPARSSTSASTRHGRRRREPGLPRPHPQGPRLPHPQARRHHGDLREVRRATTPAHPHEDLPRRPLHHGRHVDEYKPGSYQPAEPTTSTSPAWSPRSTPRSAAAWRHGDPNNMMTNIKGLYAFGEVNFAYHGATRLGANALLSCIFDGLFCGLGVANYVRDVNATPADRSPVRSTTRSSSSEQKTRRPGAQDRRRTEGNPEDPQPLCHRQGNGRGDDRRLTVVKTEERLDQVPSTRSPNSASGTSKSRAGRHRDVDQPDAQLRPRHRRHAHPRRGDR